MRFNLRALQAFEAVSRHLSVLKAAEELGITSSSVSHQLRILTEDLGYNLIEREGRNIVLTERGLQFARHLQDAFRHVQLAMVEGRSVQNDRVRIAACSSFCQGFLIDLVADTIAQEGGYEIDMRMLPMIRSLRRSLRIFLLLPMIFLTDTGRQICLPSNWSLSARLPAGMRN